MRRSSGEVAIDGAPMNVGAVALIAGYGAFAQPGRVTTTVATLGRIGEAFLDGRSGWHLQRLAPGDVETPTRIGLRRAIDRVVATRGPCVLVVVGAVVSTILGAAVACAPELGDYPEDTTLPLAWIGERLASYEGDNLVCVLIADGDERDRRRWLGELAAQVRGVVVVASSAADALDALLEAVWGDAIDHETGTVTPRSLGAYLARSLTTAAIHDSNSAITLVTPQPVASQHDPRLGRLMARGLSIIESPDLVGKVLSGRFRIQAELGRGGFGIVYRAHHDLMGRDFAIKVLTLDAEASREDAALFLQEIRAVAKLDHRNVVRIHFADVLGRRRMFFAMELLTGRDLQHILDDGEALAPTRVLAFAAQLLDGLGAAHAAGLVHADVKPANLIIADDPAGERLVLVDFGLSRLRGSGPTRAAGGTIAFMSPEQRHDGIVDARSDLYSAARVILAMLVGRVDETNSVEAVSDPIVRAALARALDDDPAARFSSAAEMSAALRGTVVDAASAVSRPPFRHAAAFTELDRDDFHGRDRDIAALVDAVLFRRCVVYAAPSGVGKTSLLRAGLLPRLTDLGVRTVYVACRAGGSVDLPGALVPGAPDLETALAHPDLAGTRVVLVLDQLESVFLAGSQVASSLFAELQTLVTTMRAQITIVLSVREEVLARVLEHTENMSPGPPLRLGPLGIGDARLAITLTLQARHFAIAPDLLDTLLADLEDAARGMPAQFGWGDAPTVYPPHLQLAGAVLYDAMPTNLSTFTLDAYQRLGGLPRILGEHLHRVLEGELTPARTAIARDVLLSLVTNAQTRNSLPESELVSMIAATPRTRDDVIDVVRFLRDRGLVVALPGHQDDTIWELAHDSLVARIEAWVTATDLARLRALELIRHRLRRSERGLPSFLDVGELREVARSTVAADLAALDAEWAGRVAIADEDRSRPATSLVALSRRAVRARRIAVSSAFAVAAVVATVLAVRWQSERSQRQYESTLRDRDIGTFTIRLSAFDWDPVARTALEVPLASLPQLEWTLHKADPEDLDSPGEPYPSADVVERSSRDVDATVREYSISARGGAAVIVIRGRGRRSANGNIETCADAIIPVRRLPGNSAPGPRRTFRVSAPTCQASRADTIELRGPYLSGGGGEPPVSYADQLPPELRVEMAPYSIDRTEVTNAAFGVFARMIELHAIPMPAYPDTVELRAADGPDYPVSFITWPEARAYCRFMGKDLPTLDQWDRALRGGLTINGFPNPAPRRTFSWPGAFRKGAAAVPDDPSRRHPFPVGKLSIDTSPDGIADLTGNLQEWVFASPPSENAAVAATDESARASAWRVSGRFRIVRGCNWNDLECAGGSSAADVTALPNQRPYDLRNFYVGFRCRTTTAR